MVEKLSTVSREYAGLRWPEYIVGQETTPGHVHPEDEFAYMIMNGHVKYGKIQLVSPKGLLFPVGGGDILRLGEKVKIDCPHNKLPPRHLKNFTSG